MRVGLSTPKRQRGDYKETRNSARRRALSSASTFLGMRNATASFHANHYVSTWTFLSTFPFLFRFLFSGSFSSFLNLFLFPSRLQLESSTSPIRPSCFSQILVETYRVYNVWLFTGFNMRSSPITLVETCVFQSRSCAFYLFSLPFFFTIYWLFFHHNVYFILSHFSSYQMEKVVLLTPEGYQRAEGRMVPEHFMKLAGISTKIRRLSIQQRILDSPAPTIKLFYARQVVLYNFVVL